MKILIASVMVMVGESAILAQSYVTNYVQADPSFRRVNGQLYNIQKSILWTNIEAECINTTGDLVVLQTFKIRRVYENRPLSYEQSTGQMYSGGPPLRRLKSETKEPGQKLLIKNYPSASAAAGQQIKVRAMRAGTAQYQGQTLELWDCGTPNIVPVVRKVP
jgi:hypothetical protein